MIHQVMTIKTSTGSSKRSYPQGVNARSKFSDFLTFLDWRTFGDIFFPRMIRKKVLFNSRSRQYVKKRTPSQHLRKFLFDCFSQISNFNWPGLGRDGSDGRNGSDGSQPWPIEIWNQKNEVCLQFSLVCHLKSNEVCLKWQIESWRSKRVQDHQNGAILEG